MRPVKTEESNTVFNLVKEGEPQEGRELYAQRVLTTEGLAYITTWELEDGERKAVSNGAPIELAAWGGYPPVSLMVGEPTEEEALLSKAHCYRALGYLHGALEKREEAPTAPELLDMWERALAETRTPPGDGASIEG